MTLLSSCSSRGHVHRPRRIEVTDAPTRADPTGTSRLRARMRAEGDRRWQVLARTLRQALIEHDLVGLRGMGRLPHGDKAGGFAVWLREELRQKVFGIDGRWLKPYVRQAAGIAQTRATDLAPAGQVDPGRVTGMETLAASELRGICEAAQQQLTRAVTHCLMANATPTKTANAAAGMIRTMRNRTRAMSEYIVAKTHATSTLSAFRSAGVTHVGVIPERLRKQRLVRQTTHGKALADDITSYTPPQSLPAASLQIGAAAAAARKKWEERFAELVEEYGSEEALGRLEREIEAVGGRLAPGVAEPGGAALGALEREIAAQGAKLEASAAEFGARLRAGTEEYVARRAAEGAAARAEREQAKQERELAYEITKAERAKEKLKKAFGGAEAEVDVVNADEDACDECMAIADDGPYSLDEAEELIPAHPFADAVFL